MQDSKTQIKDKEKWKKIYMLNEWNLNELILPEIVESSCTHKKRGVISYYLCILSTSHLKFKNEKKKTF